IKNLIPILTPAYNEEEVLTSLLQRLTGVTAKLPNYSFEFLFVNEGSTDRTLEVLRKMAKVHSEISYVNLARNFGKEVAMLA
ncbi:glycosyltransferase, partial [Planococcus sp. SIMBA_143]